MASEPRHCSKRRRTTLLTFLSYLTPERFTEAFGPTEEDYQAAIQFAERSGLRVTGTHLNRILFDVHGSVETIERVLQVKMRLYPHPEEDRTFYPPDTEPSLDPSTRVLHISGLNNYTLDQGRKGSPFYAYHEF